jgi:hypothetical protein
MISEAIGRKLALLGGFGLAARLKSTFQAALLVPHCAFVGVVADSIEGRRRPIPGAALRLERVHGGGLRQSDPAACVQVESRRAGGDPGPSRLRPP